LSQIQSFKLYSIVLDKFRFVHYKLSLISCVSIFNFANSLRINVNTFESQLASRWEDCWLWRTYRTISL